MSESDWEFCMSEDDDTNIQIEYLVTVVFGSKLCHERIVVPMKQLDAPDHY